jgi:hypothetical protein
LLTKLVLGLMTVSICFHATYSQSAGAVQMSASDALRYDLGWRWDAEDRIVYAKLAPKIVVHELADHLAGKIVDESGNVLSFYGGESVVMVKFGTDDSFVGDWRIATTPVDGTFEIPLSGEESQKWDYVRLWINSNSFDVVSSATAEGEYSDNKFNFTATRNHFVMNPVSLMSPDEQAKYDDASKFVCYQSAISVQIQPSHVVYRLQD